MESVSDVGNRLEIVRGKRKSSWIGPQKSISDLEREVENGKTGEGAP